MQITFTRTVTHEFRLDLDLPEEVQMDLDAGLGLEGLSDEGKIALYEFLADSTVIPDSQAWDARALEITVLGRGTDTPMLGNLNL